MILIVKYYLIIGRPYLKRRFSSDLYSLLLSGLIQIEHLCSIYDVASSRGSHAGYVCTGYVSGTCQSSDAYDIVVVPC